MDAKRAPAVDLVTPAATPGGADDRAPQEHSWLVFRLGPHTMCASTLDVEGIIEPKPVTPLPFTPAHLLGTFMFRDRVATAISLRTKLGVRAGEDSAQGPFIVASVGDELAAFWVDEVKEVMGEQNVAWQPMPDMLRSRVFDRYTLSGGELILHTSFASLLEADAESLPARWRASPEEAPEGAELGPLPLAGVDAAAGDTRDEDSSRSTAETAPPEAASAGPEGAAGLPEPQVRSDSAKDQSRAGLVGKEARPVPPWRDAPERRTKLQGTGTTAPHAGRLRPAPGFDATGRARDLRARAAQADAAEGHGLERRAPATGSADHSYAWPQAAPRDDVRLADAKDTRAIHASDAVVEPGWAEHRDRLPPGPPRPVASPVVGREPRRARALIGLALAVGAAILATVMLWPESRNEAPLAAERAENRVRRAVVADAPPRLPVRHPQSEPASGTVAPAEPAEPKRIAEVKTETLSLTIERPAKPATRAPGTTGKSGTGTAAATSTGQQASKGGIVHVVVRGDTLWDISRKYLGNPFRYPELVRLSGIKNPNLIHPGDIVRIRVIENRR